MPLRRVLIITLWMLAAAPGHAQGGLLDSAGVSAEQLRHWGSLLGSEQQAQRRAAYEALRTLSEDSLPAIAVRFEQLHSDGIGDEETRDAITAFRHAVGSRRADDMVDIAPGILPVLTETRDRSVVVTAEALLLLRSLERMESREAGWQIAALMSVDKGAWERELRRVQHRLGTRFLPTLLSLRAHDQARVRRWALRGIRALGMRDPEVATQIEDAHQLARLLRAYGDPLDYPALPVVMSFIDHEKLQVRQAARATVARFDRNAIWQLREAYHERTGKHADKSWGWKRTAEALYRLIDRADIERAERALEAGLDAWKRDDLDQMKKHFDTALLHYPELRGREKMAAGYAAVGAARLEQDELDAAAAAYRRALRLAPDGAAAEDWRAQVEFVSAERRLSSGLADLHAYQQALEHDAEHAAARAAVDRLSGAWTERQTALRRWAAAAAILLLSLFALGLLAYNRNATPDREVHEQNM